MVYYPSLTSLKARMPPIVPISGAALGVGLNCHHDGDYSPTLKPLRCVQFARDLLHMPKIGIMIIRLYSDN